VPLAYGFTLELCGYPAMSMRANGVSVDINCIEVIWTPSALTVSLSVGAAFQAKC
jgi:hypothetical protein